MNPKPKKIISRAAAMLLTVIMAFAGAQTAGAQEEQTLCNVTFDIRGKGTVVFGEETVTNRQTKVFRIPYASVLTITPETGYVVSSVTYDATEGLSFDLNQVDWSLNIPQYGGSDTPTITVYIVFDKALAGGADEVLAVALTADDDLSHLAGGWYKVESDLTFGHTVNLHGDTHIIIASGKTLTVNTSDEYGIYGSALTVSGEGTLNVSASNSESHRAIYVDNYTQTGCAVTLSGDNYGLNAKNDVSISGGSLTTSGADYGISTDKGAITISGGTVSSSGNQCGLFAARAMNITGGTVNASGNVRNGIRGYSVSITGGQVTASSGGIMSNIGDITLGCTSATDYITASSFTVNEGQHVKIADGQTLYGGGFPSASYTGTIVDPSALNGLMLRPTAAVTGSGTNEYTIWNAAGWDAFCDRLAADGGKDFFSGKTVKLGADIGSADNPITRRAGSADHDFTGQFNGQGHTLYVRLGTAEAPHDTKAAPFQNVTTVNSVAASIENLHVCGDIYASGKYAAGIIGSQYGNVTLRNCRSSVNIHSSAADDTSSGGLVGNGHDNLTIEGCLFDGSLTAEAADVIKCAGFVGYNSGTLTVSNSLVAPASVTIGTGTSGAISATFARGWSGTPANSYYTAPPSGGWGATQGKQARTIAAGEDVTLGHDGVATTYSVSHITAYKASEASGDDDPFIAGLLYNNNVVDVLYAGSDDAVSLTLSNTATGAPEGYQYGGYSVSAGTLSGSTLTMPDEDVTVSAALRSTGVAVPVSYVDAGGNTQTAQAIALDGTETGTVLGRLGEETWYFVGLPTVAFGRLVIQYDINLILADGCTMNVTSTTDGTSCIKVENNLHIYGQAEGTGILNAQNQVNILSSDVIFIQDGTLHIHGGNVIATYNGTAKNAKAIYFGRQEIAGDVLVIDGGTLTANGNDGYGIFIDGGDARINGGQVTATGGNSGIAVSNRTYIFSTEQIPGTLTLSGGTLTASSIETFSGKDEEGTIAVALGYTYTDGSNIYDSATASADLAALTKVTLQPCLALADAADNTAAIADHAGKTLAVALSGRTLYKDGSWNTLCLPFDISTASGTLSGDNVQAMTLNTTTSNFADGTLTLNFTAATGQTIPAGTPFIIKWDNTGVNIENPVFVGVTVSNATNDATVTDVLTFTGTYAPVTIPADGDNTKLYLGAANKLYYPNAAMTIGTHRAYFQLLGDLTAGGNEHGDDVEDGVRAFVLNFGDDEATGIITTNFTNSTNSSNEWYTLDGRRLDGQPTQRGIYINNGKKVVIK